MLGILAYTNIDWSKKEEQIPFGDDSQKAKARSRSLRFAAG
jgi:hypothetical protein